MSKKIVAMIPAHLASVRFPKKVLFKIQGLPMIEHVRRRAVLSRAFSDVIVATCDKEIQSLIEGFGGKVITTSNTHKNGTTRVAEAIEKVDCTHVVLLQADEPLLLPEDLILFADRVREDNTDTVAWNATGPIEHPEELDRHSFVKCFVNSNGRIQFCFRRSPCYGKFEDTKTMIRKILGIIAYEKNFLLELSKMKSSNFETFEFIEQMRIIENEYKLMSVAFDHTLPSINEPGEVEEVLEKLKTSEIQSAYLTSILNY
ncbi:cytidylyltransferase domain-containing protein [Leptospira noguchii]|uniref:cytidylyltransferase domain-containing protein n=1 Tax=Leptospira noguchii TaxID=28182 RepID=UPI000328550A|nr:NTP transferase domain-containing protein [Leptospira noguchii]EMS83160.1 putative 3-deoxy-D-manno-octulosonate cytidylyltransferase [Leptospira noguchii str. Hook]